MKKIMLFLLSLLHLTGCASAPVEQTPSYRQITMDEAVVMMEQEQDYIP